MGDETPAQTTFTQNNTERNNKVLWDLEISDYFCLLGAVGKIERKSWGKPAILYVSWALKDSLYRWGEIVDQRTGMNKGMRWKRREYGMFWKYEQLLGESPGDTQELEKLCTGTLRPGICTFFNRQQGVEEFSTKVCCRKVNQSVL